MKGTPVDTVWLWGSIAGMTHERAAAHVRVVCERLAPLLSDTTIGES